MWLLSLMPGLFATCLGLLIGIYVWIAQEAGDRVAAVESLGSFLGIILIAFSLTATGVLNVWAMTARDLKELSLPSDYPSAPTDRSAPDAAPATNDATPPLNRDAAEDETEVADVSAPEHGLLGERPQAWRLRFPKGPLRRLASYLTRRRSSVRDSEPSQ
jgi:hypothetical protein